MILAAVLLLNMTVGLTNYTVTVSYSGIVPHFGLTSGGYFYVLTPANITNVSSSGLAYLKVNSSYILVNPLSLTNGSRLGVTYQGGNATFLFTLTERVPQELGNSTQLGPSQYTQGKQGEKTGPDPQEYGLLAIAVLSALAFGAVRALGRSRRRA